MKMQKYVILLAIGLLLGGVARAGVKDDFDKAAKANNADKVRSILADPAERKKLLTPEALVDRIGQSFRRAAKRGHIEVIKAILGDDELYVLLVTNRSPKDWLARARDAAQEKYPRVAEYLEGVMTTK